MGHEFDRIMREARHAGVKEMCCYRHRVCRQQRAQRLRVAAAWCRCECVRARVVVGYCLNTQRLAVILLFCARNCTDLKVGALDITFRGRDLPPMASPLPVGEVAARNTDKGTERPWCIQTIRIGPISFRTNVAARKIPFNRQTLITVWGLNDGRERASGAPRSGRASRDTAVLREWVLAQNLSNLEFSKYRQLNA